MSNYKIVGEINLIITNYSPKPLSYSCPRLAVLVSSHIIGACHVIPISFFLALTRPTVMDDVHTVAMGPAVSSDVTGVSPVHPLGVCLPLSIYQCSGTPVVYCIRLLELLGQGGNGCGEVCDCFTLRHHGLSVGCSFFH